MIWKRLERLEDEVRMLLEKLAMQKNTQSDFDARLDRIADTIDRLTKAFESHTEDDKENFNKLEDQLDKHYENHAELLRVLSNIEQKMELQKSLDEYKKERREVLIKWLKIFVPVVIFVLPGLFVLIKHFVVIGIL